MSITLEKVSCPLDWLQIYRLYVRAFPAPERKPFGIIRRMQRKGKTDVWVCRQKGRFAGFAATINDETLILLDYLAVSPALRGQGLGTRMLEALKAAYDRKGIFVEIESLSEAAANQDERLRRKRFYESCGFVPLGVTAIVFGVSMELMGWQCELDFKQYHAFYRDNYSEFAARNIVDATQRL